MLPGPDTLTNLFYICELGQKVPNVEPPKGMSPYSAPMLAQIGRAAMTVGSVDGSLAQILASCEGSYTESLPQIPDTPKNHYFLDLTSQSEKIMLARDLPARFELVGKAISLWVISESERTIDDYQKKLNRRLASFYEQLRHKLLKANDVRNLCAHGHIHATPYGPAINWNIITRGRKTVGPLYDLTTLSLEIDKLSQLVNCLDTLAKCFSSVNSKKVPPDDVIDALNSAITKSGGTTLMSKRRKNKKS